MLLMFRNPANKLKLVVYPILYGVCSYIQKGGGLAGFWTINSIPSHLHFLTHKPLKRWSRLRLLLWGVWKPESNALGKKRHSGIRQRNFWNLWIISPVLTLHQHIPNNKQERVIYKHFKWKNTFTGWKNDDIKIAKSWCSCKNLNPQSGSEFTTGHLQVQAGF